MSGLGANSGAGASGGNEDEAKGNLSRMKKRLTLDLEAPKSARKQRMNELLSTPELDKLKLTTPELERLIMQQSGLSVSVIGLPGSNSLASATTPSSFLNPKNVSEEEEQYVKPFEAALAQLHSESSHGGAGSGGNQTMPGLRFPPFPTSDALPFPSDLTDVPIGRAASKHELQRSPREERDPERFQAVASTMAMAAAAAAQRAGSAMGVDPTFGYALPVPQPPTDMDVKPSIKEEPLDGDYSSIGEASCSAYGSSDSNSPDPARTPRRRSASSRNSASESFGVSPIDMEDQEAKKLERKRLRNRIAASKCRARKLERISRLEDRVKHLKVENSDLTSMVNKLKEAIYALKEEIVEHVRNGCDIAIPPGALAQTSPPPSTNRANGASARSDDDHVHS